MNQQSETEFFFVYLPMTVISSSDILSWRPVNNKIHCQSVTMYFCLRSYR